MLSFAPFELPWLAPASLAALLWLLSDTTPRQALRRGFLFGLGFFGCGTYWLYVSLNVLGGLLPPFAVLLMLCLIAATATFVAAAAWLTVRCSPPAHVTWRALIVFPAAWVLTAEFSYSIAIGTAIFVALVSFQIFVWRRVLGLRWLAIVVLILVGVAIYSIMSYTLASFGLWSMGPARG